MPTYYYTAYNLSISSEIVCPQLTQITEPPNGVDVHIRYGQVPEALEDAVASGVLYQAKPDHFLLRLDEIGAFWVRNGDEIIIEPAPDATDDEVRLFLFGSAFGALLHQRGLFVLHASAIEINKGAVLFVGPSGNGKSTTAAAFHRRRYRVLADDVCALTLDETDRPVVIPAFPQIKIWSDTAKQLEQETEKLPKVRPQLEKYALRIHADFPTDPLPLYAIYHLTTHNKPEFELKPMEDADKFRVLLNNTYRARFMDGLEMRGSHFKLGIATANTARIQRVIRPSAPFLLDELIDLLEADFQAENQPSTLPAPPSTILP